MSKPKLPELAVLALGDLSSGFRIVGPFADFDCADRYATQRGQRMENEWIATLYEPTDYGATDWLALVGAFLERAADALREEDTDGLESVMGEVAEKVDLLAEAVENLLEAQAGKEMEDVASLD